jgi:hypothetical protein
MRRFLTIMVMIMTVAGLAACGDSAAKWRQKTHIVVETPQGQVTGDSVVQAAAKERSGMETLGAGAGTTGGIQGEAVVVNLGGKYLFALLDSEDWYKTYSVFANDLTREGKANYATAGREYPKIKGARPIPPKLYPTLVTFTDLADPKSVKLVDPANLAATFGQGYRLKSVTLEITDEDVTKERIEKLLPWFTQENPIFIDWKKYPVDHPLQHVNKNSFIVGN